MKKLAFSIEKYEIEEINNSQFSKLKLYICHNLDNKNGSFISYETMKKAEPTLINKPIIMKLNRNGTDFLEHEEDVIVVGFIPETDNNIHYEEIDGRMFLVAEGIIWKYYSSKTMDIFKRDKSKGVSMEIQVVGEHTMDNGLIEIDEYAYLAICLLGDKYQTGMWNTQATVLKFGKSNIDKISKEWETFVSNNNQNISSKDRIMHRLSNNINYNLNDTDKISEKEVQSMSEANKNIEVADVSNDNEVVDKEEVKSEVNEEVNTKDFSDNESTEEMSKDEMGCDGKKYEKEVETQSEEKVEMAEDEEVEEEEKTEDETEVDEVDEEVKEEEMEEYKDEMGCDGKKYSEISKELEEVKKEMSKKDDKILEMNELVMSFKNENEKLSNENKELKNFKEKIQEQERQDKVKSIFSNLSNVLSKEEIDNWKEKAKSYEDIATFEQQIKSFACDKLLNNRENKEQNLSTFSSMAVNLDTEEDSKPESVWTRISKRVSK